MPIVGNGISVLIVLLTALIIGGSKSRNTLKLMFGKGGITVGNDIPREDVKGFSYIDSQNNK